MENETRRLFRREFADSARFDEILAPYTTFKIGGPADIYLSVKTQDEIARAFNLAKSSKIDVFILGGGSNILVSDKGVRGLVIGNHIKGVESKENVATVKSGVEISELLKFCGDRSLAGLEFMAGIYGTVGGAAIGNAGAYGKSFGETILNIRMIDIDGRKIELKRKDFELSYRSLVLPEKHKAATFFIYECELELKKGHNANIRSQIDEILSKRNGKMPDPLPSAGCFFKNVENPGSCFSREKGGKLSAGKLLDEIGAKSMGNEKVGVHKLHANIIMNRGKATAKDVLVFSEQLRKKVAQRFGVNLDREIKLVGEF